MFAQIRGIPEYSIHDLFVVVHHLQIQIKQFLFLVVFDCLTMQGFCLFEVLSSHFLAVLVFRVLQFVVLLFSGNVTIVILFLTLLFGGFRVL